MSDSKAAAPGADRERLAQVLRSHSILRGSFVLASGQTSDIYIDCRRTTLDPEGANLVGRCILDLVERQGLQPQAVGGLTLGADPIATAVAMVSWQIGRPIPAFIVRKATKQHGTGKRIEGWLPEGGAALIVEDVVTTGGSSLEAIEAVEAAGGRVAGVIAILDREQGGAEALKKYPYFSLFRLKDLL